MGKHFGKTLSGERFITFFDLYVGFNRRDIIVFRNYRYLRRDENEDS